MSRARRHVIAVAALAAVLALPACSDGSAAGSGDEASSPEPTAEAEPTGSPGDTDGPEPRDGIPPLPDGEVSIVATIPVGSLRGVDDFNTAGGVVFTDDLILIAPLTQRLHAIDRETHEVVWSTRLRMDRDDNTGVCSLYPPPGGATAIAVFSGHGCGRLDTYELATGKHLSTEHFEIALGQNGIDGPTQVGDVTYWADPDNNVLRIEPDGSIDRGATAAELGFTEEDNVASIAGVADSDVLVARVEPSFSLDDDADDLFATDHGYFLGLRAGEDGRLTEIWRRPVRKAIGPDVVRDTTGLRERMGGVVVNAVRRGIRTPRMTQFDPETGDLLGRQLVLRRDPPGGLPEWVHYNFEDVDTKIEGSQVIGAASNRSGDESVVRYDLARHRIRWAWSPRFGRASVTYDGAQPLGMSTDGGSYYVAGNRSDVYRLFELDFATGKQARAWNIPASVGDQIDEGQLFLDGNHLVVFERYLNEFSGAAAIVLEVGER